MNLAWKLERAVAGRAGDPLLDTYERERSPHVRETLAGTIFIGKRLEAGSPFGRWRRRQEMRLIRAFPSAREIARRKGIRRPPLRDGFLDRGSPTAGLALPQVEVRSGGGVRRLDELLGYRFALVAAPGALADGDAEWAAGRGVGVWRVGDDFEETGGRLVQWMRERQLDFALARPDRYIFAAGTSGDLARARAEFDRWLA